MQHDRCGQLTGAEAFYRILEMQDGYEALTLKLLDQGQLGIRSPRIIVNLQRSFLLITEAGSCYWGCRGGDHAVENLLRRYCNYAFGAIRLACFGLYDEALALIRSFAEVGNLLQLFTLDKGQLHSWQQADTRQKLENFSPFRIRLAIEQLGKQPIIGRDAYSRLCEMGIHVSPTLIYLSHEIDEKLYFGGNFSIPGFLLVINQMAHLIAPVLALIEELIDVPNGKKKELCETSRDLIEAASWLNVDNYKYFFEQFRAEQIKELVQQELAQLAEGEFQSMVQAASEELTELGELPADLSGHAPAEVKDKVFTQIFKKLSQQALSSVHEHESSWLKQSAEIALIEAVLRRVEALQRPQEQEAEDNNTA